MLKIMNKKKAIYFFVGSFLILQMIGCYSFVQYSDVSDQQPYKELIGKKYIILKDFYLIRLVIDGEKGEIVSLRLCGTGGFPKELDKGNIGDIINDKVIVGIFPKGSSFT